MLDLAGQRLGLWENCMLFGRMRDRMREQRAFLKTLPWDLRMVLLTGVFCTFSALGLITDLSNGGRSGPWWTAAIGGIESGLMAVGVVLAVTLRPWMFILAIGAHVGYVWLMRKIVPGVPRNLPIDENRMGWVAAAAMMCLALGYSFFALFMRRESRRTAHLRAEMNLARRIHETLVPEISMTHGRLSAFGRSLASTEMGGDLIDAIQGDGHVDLVIADVSGHGVRAGVIMGMCKAALRMRRTSRVPLSELFGDLNRVVTEVADVGMFVTFACLRFEDSGVVRVAMGGHPPILVHRARAGKIEQIDNERLPLGISIDEVYTERVVDAAPGDTFLMYTDGITEVAGADGRNFGTERVALVAEKTIGGTLQSIYDALAKTAAEHGARLDDQSVLLARL